MKKFLKNILFLILLFLIYVGIFLLILFVWPNKNSIINVIYMIIIILILFFIISRIEKELSFLKYLFEMPYFYKLRSKKWDNLPNTARFYKINWSDDYLHDLLVFLDRWNDEILLSEEQIKLCMDKKGKVNSFELYTLLVSNFRKLPLSVITLLKHYIESKSARYAYKKYLTYDNVCTLFLTILPITIKLTLETGLSKSQKSMLNKIYENVVNMFHTHLLIVVAITIIGIIIAMLGLFTLVLLLTYNEKHSQHIDVIHQALSDAYDIKTGKIKD